MLLNPSEDICKQKYTEVISFSKNKQKTLKMHLPYEPAIVLLAIIPGKWKPVFIQNVHTNVHSSFMHNRQKGNNWNVFFSRWMVKQTWMDCRALCWRKTDSIYKTSLEKQIYRDRKQISNCQKLGMGRRNGYGYKWIAERSLMLMEHFCILIMEVVT